MLIYDSVFTDESEIVDIISDALSQDNNINVFEYLCDNGYIVDGDFLVSYNDADEDYRNAYDLAVKLYSERFNEYNGEYVNFNSIIKKYRLEDDFYDWIFNICSGNDCFGESDYDEYCNSKLNF